MDEFIEIKNWDVITEDNMKFFVEPSTGNLYEWFDVPKDIHDDYYITRKRFGNIDAIYITRNDYYEVEYMDLRNEEKKYFLYDNPKYYEILDVEQITASESMYALTIKANVTDIITGTKEKQSYCAWISKEEHVNLVYVFSNKFKYAFLNPKEECFWRTIKLTKIDIHEYRQNKSKNEIKNEII